MMLKQNFNFPIKLSVLVLFFLFSPCVFAIDIEVYKNRINIINTGLERGDATSFRNAIDEDAIVKGATDGLVTDPKWKTGIQKGIIKSLRKTTGNHIASLIKPGSYVKLLRLKQNSAGYQALIRLDYGEIGNGYMDLYLEPDSSGEIKIVDWYNYGTGQYFTETLKLLVGLSAPTPTVLGKLFDMASGRKEVSEVLKKIIDLNRNQEYEEVARIFLRLDKAYRKSRTLNIIALQAAIRTDNMKIYEKILANLDRYHGNDIKLSFVLLDYYFFTNDKTKFDRNLHRLKTIFGDSDATLDVFQANFCLQQGDLSCALSAASKAISLEPDYEYGYWPMLQSQIQLGDFTGSVATARILEAKFGYQLDSAGLSEIEGAEKFIDSRAYRQWRNGI